MEKTKHSLLIWGLGLSQIVGYGTLYYSFSILAGDTTKSFGQTQSWFYLIVSIALISGGVVMPFAGRLFDHFGAANLMVVGSALSAMCMAATALSTTPMLFALAMCAAQIVSSMVLYDAAFTAIVQSGIGASQNRIMALTLIAGFASSIFWPFTTLLDSHFGWRNTMLIYAAMNLVFCLPIHLWAAQAGGRVKHNEVPRVPSSPDTLAEPEMDRATSLRLMILITAGFSLTGVTLSSILSQMVPLLQSLGLGGSSLIVSTLFGPAQVAIRGVNLFFGKGQNPLTISIVALSLLPTALLLLALTAPWVAGAVVFAVLVGLASGLKSIVQGTLPLAVFGRVGYGARLGVMSGVRYVLAALAPFTFAWSSENFGPRIAAVIFSFIGIVGVLCFFEVARLLRMRGGLGPV
ncbi:MAG: arsenite efflux MFS transporter ArsK [Alphaproteobacteria bacterium]|nr:arsenite efflux MFS transporter ArsK [Alphaproteobacteria bacterium]